MTDDITRLLTVVFFVVAVAGAAATVFTIYRIKESAMSEVQDAVNAVVEQLGKAKAEIVGKIADLEAQIAAGQTPDLTALKAAAQALDDVVPDAPVEEPAEEPVAEEPAE